MDELSKEEWQEEMAMDAYSERASEVEEAKKEYMMTSDMDYCLSELDDEVMDVESAIQLLLAKLNSYGYEVDRKELMEMI